MFHADATGNWFVQAYLTVTVLHGKRRTRQRQKVRDTVCMHISVNSMCVYVRREGGSACICACVWRRGGVHAYLCVCVCVFLKNLK